MITTTVKDVMTSHVACARTTAPYKDMAVMLHEQRVSAFPVVDDDFRVVGVVSESDLLTKEALGGAVPYALGILRHREQAKAAGLTARDLMTSPAVTVGPDEPVRSAARLMYSRRVKRLPVVDADGKLIGIVSRTDVLTVYNRTDTEIREEILRDVILQGHLCDPAGFQVTVADGVVTIAGKPETAAVGRDILADTQHVEGVVAVRDRFYYPPAEHHSGPGPQL